MLLLPCISELAMLILPPQLLHIHEICDPHTGGVQYTHVLGRVK